METLLLSVAAFGFWFWAITAVWFIVALVGIAKESPTILTITVVAALVFLEWMTPYTVLTYTWEHPLYAIGGLLSYAAIGAFYAILRWNVWIKNSALKFKHIYQELQNSRPHMQKHDLKNEAFQEVFGYQKHNEFYAPLIQNNKSRFYSWISLWPISMIFLVIDEPITKFCQWVYYTFSGRLQAYANRQFKSID